MKTDWKNIACLKSGSSLKSFYYLWTRYEKGCQQLISNISNVRHKMNQFKAKCSSGSAAPPIIVTPEKATPFPSKQQTPVYNTPFDLHVTESCNWRFQQQKKKSSFRMGYRSYTYLPDLHLTSELSKFDVKISFEIVQLLPTPIGLNLVKRTRRKIGRAMIFFFLGGGGANMV